MPTAHIDAADELVRRGGGRSVSSASRSDTSFVAPWQVVVGLDVTAVLHVRGPLNLFVPIDMEYYPPE